MRKLNDTAVCRLLRVRLQAVNSIVLNLVTVINNARSKVMRKSKLITTGLLEIRRRDFRAR